MTMPGDLGGEGDWLVPYDGAGGINDVTGAVLIDGDTGVIDMATWIGPDDGIDHLTLAQLDEMFHDISTGLTPQDNPVPEPTTLAIGMPMPSRSSQQGETAAPGSKLAGSLATRVAGDART